MKVRFFLLGTEKHASSKRLEKELKYLFTDHLSDNGAVQAFDEIKSATADIAKAVEDTHALIFIAETGTFGTTKLMLAKAFGFELGCDTALLEKACEVCEKNPGVEDYEFSVTHAFVPNNARTFVLSDGKYAGFSVANGNQTIILIPYEKDRTSVLLYTQVIPYINAAYHVSIEPGKLKNLHAEWLLEKLTQNDMKLAVAGTNTASFFKEYLSVNEELSERISVSPMTEKRGNMQPVDYIVNLSITAAELLSCRYGVAMSNAFYTGDSPESEKIVYLAVSNERETAVREIHSFKEEDIPGFLTRCSGDFCVFISDIIENDKEYNADSESREKAAAGRYKKAIVTVSALIVALCVFCCSYFHVKDYSFSQWADSFIELIFPAGNPFEGIFDNSSPGDGEDVGNASETTTVEAETADEASTDAENENISTDENADDTSASSEN